MREGVVLADTHGGGGPSGEEGHGSTKRTSSPVRLLVLALIMVGFTVFTFGTSLFSRGPTGVTATATNWTLVFIPVWVGLTISTVVISMWFAKRILEAERSRDPEEGAPPQVSHPHE